jgi:Leucine-rich repeat (LRR) protein
LGNLTNLKRLYLSDNQLCGEIPVELKNMPSISYPSLMFIYVTPNLKLNNNHLTASDAELIAWLDSRNPGWDTTQTSCSGFFTTPIVKVAENAGSVTLTVQRNGDTSGTLEIDYATTDVSAEQGYDYIGATATLNWADGDVTDKSFTITINDDSNSEINETFTITLSRHGESLDKATIVIEDNEPADCAVVTQIPSTECEILTDIYNSTGGANWERNAGWNVTNMPCSWHGVSCSGGHVSRLSLSGNRLTGSIPRELGNLTHLEELWLSFNQLTGSIPSELGNLSNLEFLSLAGNQLTGSIPTELGNLTNLKFLYLAFNQITGPIPSELGNLTNLMFLDLFFNQVTGSIPSELGNLSHLESIQLFGNQLTGSIPSELGNLSNLDSLDLSSNQLTGSIPSELGNLTNLEKFRLSGNQLTGSIPSELGNLSNLWTLNLDDNQLTGSIPKEFGNLSNLSSLDLSSNQLTGSIPSELGNLSNLSSLDLSSNQLTGSIPTELGNLSNLDSLDLSSNQLTGSIPTELGNLSNLDSLDLSSNQLTGSIPSEMGNLNNLWLLNLADNQLTGSIPKELGNLSNLEFLWLNNNELCGEIPVELKNLSNIHLSDYYLTYLELGNNHLTASDSELIAWLDSHNPGWDETQTPCPQECKLQVDLEKDSYSLGELFQARLTEESACGYNLYAAVVMPDGNFFALKNTNELAPINTVAYWEGQRILHSPVMLLDLTLPDNLPSGEYCLYGILSPENVLEMVDLWVWTRQCFEVSTTN